jgi:hypothetical protein
MQTRGGYQRKNNRRIKSKEKKREREKETALPDVQTGEKDITMNVKKQYYSHIPPTPFLSRSTPLRVILTLANERCGERKTKIKREKCVLIKEITPPAFPAYRPG